MQTRTSLEWRFQVTLHGSSGLRIPEFLKYSETGLEYFMENFSSFFKTCKEERHQNGVTKTYNLTEKHFHGERMVFLQPLRIPFQFHFFHQKLLRV